MDDWRFRLAPWRAAAARVTLINMSFGAVAARRSRASVPLLRARRPASARPHAAVCSGSARPSPPERPPSSPLPPQPRRLSPVVVLAVGDRRVFSLATASSAEDVRRLMSRSMYVFSVSSSATPRTEAPREARRPGCVRPGLGRRVVRRDDEVRRPPFAPRPARRATHGRGGGPPRTAISASPSPRPRIRVADGPCDEEEGSERPAGAQSRAVAFFCPVAPTRRARRWRTWGSGNARRGRWLSPFVGVQRERSRAIHGVRRRSRALAASCSAMVSRRLKRSDERNRSGRVEVEGGPDAVRARVECEFGVREGRSPRRADVSRMCVGVCGRALAAASRDPSPTSLWRLPRLHTHDLFFYRTVIPRDTSRCAVPDAGGSVGGRGVRGRGAAAVDARRRDSRNARGADVRPFFARHRRTGVKKR